MLATAEPADGKARGYVEKTYCERFEREGWIYADGALSIDAHTWLLESGSEECGIAEADGRSRTVPCEQLERAEPEPLDCALLRHVRRDEVRAYFDGLGRPAGLACDDGTPLDELGVPSR